MANIFKAKTLLGRTGIFSHEVIAPNLVYNTGNQTIAGNKSFTASSILTIRTISGFKGTSPLSLNLIAANDNSLSPTVNLAGNINLTAGTGSIFGTSTYGSINLNAGGLKYDGQVNLNGNVNINNNALLNSRTIKIYKTGFYFGNPGTAEALTIDNNNISINTVAGGGAGFGLLISGVAVTPALYATSANLASTGSTLNTKIDNLSGYINSTDSNIVFTTGDQAIGGNKTFLDRFSAKTGFFGDNNFASGDWIGISAGSGNYVSGNYSFIGGGCCNCAIGNNTIIGGGARNIACCSNSTVGGGCCNCACGCNATVGGGCGNCAWGVAATVGGGCSNRACGINATIGGGGGNCACCSNSTVGGGGGNCACSCNATIGGGGSNTAFGCNATIAGGCSNRAVCVNATVGGGCSNTACGDNTTVGGGCCNCACGCNATIGGGCQNSACGSFAFVGGGMWITAALHQLIHNVTTTGFVDDVALGLCELRCHILRANGRRFRLHGQNTRAFIIIIVVLIIIIIISTSNWNSNFIIIIIIIIVIVIIIVIIIVSFFFLLLSRCRVDFRVVLRECGHEYQGVRALAWVARCVVMLAGFFAPHVHACRPPPDGDAIYAPELFPLLVSHLHHAEQGSPACVDGDILQTLPTGWSYRLLLLTLVDVIPFDGGRARE